MMTAQDMINAAAVLDTAALGRAAASAEKAAAAAPPPPPHTEFALGCVALEGCKWGLGRAAWGGGRGAPPPIRSCSRCGEARYCGVACQRADWQSGRHKKYCGKLRAPPRPLRLVARVVRQATVAHLMPPSFKCWTEEEEETAVAAAMAARRSLPGRELSGGALARMLAALPAPPTRLLLLLPHCWAHAVSGSGETRPADVSIFDVDTAALEGARGGEALLAAALGALPYIFREEDRLAEGVRYEPSTGYLVLGRPCPPRMARVMGGRVDARTSLVTNAGFLGGDGFGFNAVMMGPPRWRWATMGPFECSEMALEDICIKSVELFSPARWPRGWYVLLLKLEA